MCVYGLHSISAPAGRWMIVQGNFRRRAHMASFISVHVGVDQRCRAPPSVIADVESPALPTMSTRNVPAGRWIRVHGKLKIQAHPTSLIIVHVGVGQRCRTSDVESPAILSTTSKRNVPAGRWRKDLDKGTRRAHIFRGVRIHVGVDQRCRARTGDVKPPATLPTMSTHNVPVGRWIQVR